MKEQTNVTGWVEFLHYDQDMNLIEKRSFKNLVVTTGLEWITSRMASNSAAVMKYIAVGTDNTAPAAGQTALISELARVAVSPSGGSVSGATVTYTAEFGPGVGTGTLQEAGIFQESSASTMLSRVIYTSIVKSASDTIVIQWTVAGS